MPRVSFQRRWPRLLGDPLITSLLLTPCVVLLVVAALIGPTKNSFPKQDVPAAAFNRDWAGYAAEGVFELHHPTGGTVSEVMVRARDVVRRGQVLVRFDDWSDRQSFHAAREALAEAEAERAVVDHLLGLSGPPRRDDPLVARYIARYALLRDTVLAEAVHAQSGSTSALAHAQRLRAEIAEHDRRKTPVHAPDARPRTVFRDGKLIRIDPVSEPPATPERVALLHRLTHAEAVGEHQADRHVEAQARYVAHLQARSAAIAANLPMLRAKVVALANRLQSAEVRAPFDAVVLSLDVVRPGDELAPGDLLLSLRAVRDPLGRTAGVQ